MAENTSDTVSISPPIWLQTPAERQITIPQLKTADKPKSPLACSPSPEAVSSLNSIVASKDPSNVAAVETKTSTSGEKTQDRHSESPKAQSSKAEPSSFTVKQESSRTAMKASSSLAHDHRGPRHSSHFSSCGKTPSIREVSNEDQEDEVEQQEVAPHPPSQNADSSKTVVSLTPPRPEANVKTSESLAPAASEPLPVSLRPSVSCGSDAGQRQSMSPVSKVQNISPSALAPANALSKQQPANICSSNTAPQISVATSASASALGDKSRGSKSEGQDRSERPASEDGVQANRSAAKALGDPGGSGSKREVNTCVPAARAEQRRDVPAVNMVSSLNNVILSVNKKDKTVSTGAIESGSVSLQKKEDPISPKIKNVKDSEQLSKNNPVEKAQHKSSDSEHCSSKKEEPLISLKEKQKCSASATANESVSSAKSKPRPDPQPVAHAAAKTEKETKTLEVKPHGAAAPPPVPAVKGSPNSKQRDLSKDSAPSNSNYHDSKRKDASMPPAGADVRREEPVQPTRSPPPADVKQRETQPKSPVATSAHPVKENTDMKPKSPSPKTVPSSSTPKTPVAPSPLVKQSFDAKHKDPAPKAQAPLVKNHQDPKPKHPTSPLAAPDVPPQPDPPAVLPKPATKKETHSSASAGAVASGRVSSCAPQEASGKTSKESPKSETLKPDPHKGPETRITTPDKQASSSGKKEQAERKKKEAVQEAASAQKTAKRDASRAAPSAQKDTSDKDTGRGKQQKESPRSSGNRK